MIHKFIVIKPSNLMDESVNWTKKQAFKLEAVDFQTSMTLLIALKHHHQLSYSIPSRWGRQMETSLLTITIEKVFTIIRLSSSCTKAICFFHHLPWVLNGWHPSIERTLMQRGNENGIKVSHGLIQKQYVPFDLYGGQVHDLDLFYPYRWRHFLPWKTTKTLS